MKYEEYKIIQPRDIFDRIMTLPGLKQFYGLYYKNKSVLLYILFGGLTTIVSIASFAFTNIVLHIHELAANVISWICAVTFAYITNRTWVFRSGKSGKYLWAEMISFYGGRLFTLGIEELLLLVFGVLLHMNSLIIKTAAQFVVLILNYFISKFWVFSERNR